MPREKNQRRLSFKPIVKEYIPANGEFTGVSTLLHEEIEAIYLMDVLGLYQEDAAKKMEISRPTFTRILKSARHKLAVGLVSGYKINIEDNKSDTIIAICTDSNENFTTIDPRDQFIIFVKKCDSKVEIIKTIPNPLYQDNKKPAIVLPQIFLENNVNFFISSKIGEGLKNSLLSKGIKPISKGKIDTLDCLLIL
jgi:predicted DNA-binding protein (UPF0251 family)